MEIGPSGCGEIQVTTNSGCEASINSQSLPVTFSTSGSGSSREIKVALATAKMEWTNRSASCGTVGSKFSNGEWNEEWKFKGTWSGSQVGVYMDSANPGLGLFLTGSKSENPATQPRFSGEEAGLVSGKASKAFVFTVAKGSTSYQCSSVAYSTSWLGSDITRWELGPGTYSGCTGPLSAATSVTTNNCQVVLKVSNTNPSPYVGTAELVCGVGKQLEISAPSLGCLIAMPAQTLGNVTYTTTGSGTERRIVAEIQGEGLTYTKLSGGVVCGGSSTTGSFSGGVTLEGVE
jgi:hypothetical protein